MRQLLQSFFCSGLVDFLNSDGAIGVAAAAHVDRAAPMQDPHADLGGTCAANSGGVSCLKPCGAYRRELMRANGSYSMPQPKKGGCLCGAIQFTVEEAPYRMMHCHCNMCKRQGGGAFITWAAFADHTIRYFSGEHIVKTYQSSTFGYRRFCPLCGSTISLNYHGQPGTTWLTAGSLEGDVGCCPDSHIMLNYKAPWYDLTEHVLHRFPEGG
eukprot:gnl/MRDRNA2_/MRDRNA2_206785_c0_seq1.p1 gnl/MRDRNA2_/MRDRNA2_206785_c0~~gnl/MRDRNA2_/MRDRNA2_206785_c0_seq1.p1  ORF type:complete len:212 (-),score=23.12 gnl/MRDRNA2_/MRDRNA2_206785_c0_seq1:38-673(-)